MNMLRPSLLALALALALPGFAAPYQPVDADSILRRDGESASVDLAATHQAIARLGQHAGDYPPRFDRDEDKQQAIADLGLLNEVLALFEYFTL